MSERKVKGGSENRRLAEEVARLKSQLARALAHIAELEQRNARLQEQLAKAKKRLAYWCQSCQKVHYAPLPPELQKGGLFGP